MNLQERTIIFITFLIACLGLALTAGAIGTKYWVVSNPIRLHSNGSADTKSNGYIHLGLFELGGYVDYGYGPRPRHGNILNITYYDTQFMIRELQA